MGSGGIAFSGGSPCFTCSKTDYMHSDKTRQNKPSPRSPTFDSWGQYKHRQAFPWHPSRSTRDQTTNMTDMTACGTYTSSEHYPSTNQELSYQPKLHQLMCYCLKRPSKTLICIQTTNPGSCCTCCRKIHCYLLLIYIVKRQIIAREVGGHQRVSVYTSRKILLQVQKRSVQQSSPVFIDSPPPAVFLQPKGLTSEASPYARTPIAPHNRVSRDIMWRMHARSSIEERALVGADCKSETG